MTFRMSTRCGLMDVLRKAQSCCGLWARLQVSCYLSACCMIGLARQPANAAQHSLRSHVTSVCCSFTDYSSTPQLMACLLCHAAVFWLLWHRSSQQRPLPQCHHRRSLLRPIHSSGALAAAMHCLTPAAQQAALHIFSSCSHDLAWLMMSCKACAAC